MLDKTLTNPIRKNMDLKDIRSARLKEWFAGRTLPTAEKSYISQLTQGKTSFGERAARRLEVDYSMPSGYLDQPYTDEDGTPGEGQKSAPSEEQRISDAGLVLAYITRSEMDLLSDYRQATDMGKTLIRTTARTARKGPSQLG